MPRFYVVMTAGYCAAIFWLSHQQALDLGGLGLRLPQIDKLAHAAVYAGLATVVSLGLRRSGGAVPPVRQFLLPVVFAAVYGLTDEIHQLFVPTRTFEWWDLAADALGAALANGLLCFVWWRVHRPEARVVMRASPDSQS